MPAEDEGGGPEWFGGPRQELRLAYSALAHLPNLIDDLKKVNQADQQGIAPVSSD